MSDWDQEDLESRFDEGYQCGLADGAKRLIARINTMTGDDARAALNTRKDKLRREGAVAALVALKYEMPSQCPSWESIQRAINQMADKIQSGEVTPWE